jgi:anti-anti-sigma regulatory factor
MGHAKQRSEDGGQLHLQGDLTVDRAVEIKQALIDAMGNASRLHIVLDHITAIDLSALQLICAAHRSAVAADKHLTMEGHRAEVIETMAKDAGFLRQQGCMMQLKHNCLWKKEGRS